MFASANFEACPPKAKAAPTSPWHRPMPVLDRHRPSESVWNAVIPGPQVPAGGNELGRGGSISGSAQLRNMIRTGNCPSPTSLRARYALRPQSPPGPAGRRNLRRLPRRQGPWRRSRGRRPQGFTGKWRSIRRRSRSSMPPSPVGGGSGARQAIIDAFEAQPDAGVFRRRPDGRSPAHLTQAHGVLARKR